MIRAMLLAGGLLLCTAADGNQSEVNESSAQAETPAGVPKSPAERLTVTVLGQPDAVRGDIVVLQAVTTGNVSSLKWLISPAVSGLVVLDGGRSAVFSNRAPGVYRIVVAAAADGAVDLAEHQFEILDVPKSTDTAAAATATDGNTNAVVQLEEKLVQLLNAVPSRTRISEARILSGCFRTTANRIEAGLFPAGGDPVSDVERQAILALGNAAPAWQEFLRWVREHLSELHQQGVAMTTASSAPFLAEVASVLARAQ